MSRQRSILALILAVFATFAISFSSFAATPKAATYTPAQIEQIQKYVPKITEFRGRMDELQTLIQKRNWIDTRTFIHGPLGQLRQDMAYVTRYLLPKDQPAARKAAKDVFGHLETIDKAAEANSYEVASQNYREALKDFDAFLQLLPQG
jgi:photosystem II protein PsbQ